MLQWSILHLTQTVAVNANYETVGDPAVTLDEIKRFRQLESKAPGHPEYHWVSGVETTTGPLGQGVATSVGMAMAEKFLANRYNKPGYELFDYRVYAVCGDGCMMEGVGSEAASLAGHLGLDNLCWIYDNNHITIEGSTSITFTEDVIARFIAYRWNVMRVGDANDIGRIEETLRSLPETRGRPTLIVIDSHIGYGSPKVQDTAEAHGDPLGADEVKVAKRNYGWPEDAEFLVPPEVYEDFARGVGARGAAAHRSWLEKLAGYRLTYPALAAEIEQMQRRDLPEGWDRDLPVFAADAKGNRRPRCVRCCAQRDCAQRAVDVGWLGRCRTLEPDHTQVSGRGGFSGAKSRRPESAFRHPRARHGCDLQRARGIETETLLRDVFHLQRLCASSFAAGRLDGAAGDLCIHS